MIQLFESKMEMNAAQNATVRNPASSILMSGTREEDEKVAQHSAMDVKSSTSLSPLSPSLCDTQMSNCKQICRWTRTSSWSRHTYIQIAFLLGIATQSHSVTGFSPFFLSEMRPQLKPHRRTMPCVASTRAPTVVDSVVAVQPLEASSQERRKSAQEALDEARQGTDEHRVWQILQKQRRQQRASESFRPLPVRPKGRPDSVPGAMNMSTMLKLREVPYDRQRQASLNPFHQAASTSLSQPAKKRRGRPRKYPQQDAPVASPAAITTATNAVAAAATVTAPMPDQSQRLAPTVSPSASNSPLPIKKRENAATKLKTHPKQQHKNIKKQLQLKTRKRVVKTMPKAKANQRHTESGLTTGMITMSDASTGGQDPPALQRYYRTELLTAEEEYSLGRKVQFMVQCEEVYEGLFALSHTHPTIAEWATACGFTDSDELMSRPDYVETPYVAQVRPTNNNDNAHMTLNGDGGVILNNFFVGNGVAGANGPGRGRGRVKKPPQLKLKAFYDDSAVHFPSMTDQDEIPVDKIDLWQHKLQPGEAVLINEGTPRDFVDLMLTAKEGKQRMVQCNMRLVVSIAKRYKHVGVNIADLVQEGSIGLTRAAEKFDPGKGFKFSTYASWWIQQAVFRSIAYHSRTIRLPVHVHNLLNRVRRTRLQLQQELGRTPADEEIAVQLGMTPEKYIKMLRLTRRAISLEKPKYQNNPKDIGQESELLLGDTIDATTVIPDENTPEQSVDQSFFQDDLKEMLKILSEDERRVICARYGLEDGLTRTATAVAAQMRQSKSWVRSQECRALRKLRRPWYEKRLWEHQNSLTG